MPKRVAISHMVARQRQSAPHDTCRSDTEIHADKMCHVADEFTYAMTFLAEQIGERSVDFDLG